MNSFKKQFELSYNDDAHRQWMDEHNEWFSVVLWTERTGNILAGEKDIIFLQVRKILKGWASIGMKYR